jgi:2-isopropylmalate synthase
MTDRVWIYDTTLRDGAQAEGIGFSVEDKVKIVTCLDEFGIDYIEGGWPGSNPKDVEFFRRARELPLRHARLCAFGSTRHRLQSVETDPNLAALVAADTPVVTIFGKSWILHVERILGSTPAENLRLVEESVRFLKDAGKEVIFDAEHFYDGFLDDAGYALEVLRAARGAGADVLVLCDTNGGMICEPFRSITARVVEELGGAIGVHVHNDSGCAVANSIEGVRLGANHVQGTFGGIGERCGNADLVTIIPNLILKMQRALAMDRGGLKQLTHVARYVSAVANHQFPENSPYVGSRAFAHKGGIHVNSVMKQARTYEHVEPEDVGAGRRLLVSELAGRSNILHLARTEGIDLGSDQSVPRAVVNEIKRLEHEGYQFEGAEASAALIVRRVLGQIPVAFELVGFRVIVERRRNDTSTLSEATVKVRVDGREKLSVGEGNGPVAALDAALRTALAEFYPEVSTIRLTDYRVRVVDEDRGSAATVRVVINSADTEGSWGTIGASENIIEASWLALVDSIIYGLIRHGAIDRFNGDA